MFTIEETFVCTLPGIARIKTFKGWSKLYASNLKKDGFTNIIPSEFFVWSSCSTRGIRRFRCDVGLMISRELYALKCRSHSAEDAGITSSLLCAIRQCRIRLFALFPPIKWVKTSVAVWHGKGSVSYFRISLNTRSFSGSVDAVVVDADWTIVPSGACWNQSTGLTFTFFLGGMSACFRWVMGESASTRDPYDQSKKLTHLTHWPMTHQLIVYSGCKCFLSLSVQSYAYSFLLFAVFSVLYLCW